MHLPYIHKSAKPHPQELPTKNSLCPHVGALLHPGATLLRHVIQDGLRPRLQVSNLLLAPALPRPACHSHRGQDREEGTGVRSPLD